MEKTWRWFGPSDKVTLDMLPQIGVEGIVTSLHSVPIGEIWTVEAIRAVQETIASHDMRWSVVESLPVSEEIKYAGPGRDRLIENYKVSLAHLGQCGIHTVCYNFMPVIDWIRTELEYPLGDGTSSLYFDYIRFAYFDLKILAREGAEKDYTADTLAKVEALDRVITEEERRHLVDVIIVKTQGFVNANFRDDDDAPVRTFKALMALYNGITKEKLRENLVYFLRAIMPVCEEYGMQMCIHPDDPPMPVLGLPRIVTDEEDIAWMLDAVDNPHNGLTFCAGSLSSGAHNDVVRMARRFAPRTRFVHLRSCDVFDNGNFIEAPHTAGRANLVELVRIFEKQDPTLPFRVDHGKTMLGDEKVGYNPGYSFHGRMLALGQVEGMMAAVRDEIKNQLI